MREKLKDAERRAEETKEKWRAWRGTGEYRSRG